MSSLIWSSASSCCILLSWSLVTVGKSPPTTWVTKEIEKSLFSLKRSMISSALLPSLKSRAWSRVLRWTCFDSDRGTYFCSGGNHLSQDASLKKTLRGYQSTMPQGCLGQLFRGLSEEISRIRLTYDLRYIQNLGSPCLLLNFGELKSRRRFAQGWCEIEWVVMGIQECGIYR